MPASTQFGWTGEPNKYAIQYIIAALMSVKVMLHQGKIEGLGQFKGVIVKYAYQRSIVYYILAYPPYTTMDILPYCVSFALFCESAHSYIPGLIRGVRSYGL